MNTARQYLARMVAEWDLDEDPILAVPARTPAAGAETEYDARMARREDLRLVHCGRCGLEVPRDTSIRVLVAKTQPVERNRSYFLCCWDCLARWSCELSELRLHPDAEAEAVDPYSEIRGRLYDDCLNMDELRDVISICRQQLRAMKK